MVKSLTSEEPGAQSADVSWQCLQLARQEKRPKASDYIRSFEDFDELHGDRMYGDCQAVIGGTAMFHQQSVMLLGQEKGHDLHTRIKHNFGMPRPEGYRKVTRLYRLAERYRMPIVIFLDSPGAYAGVDAEARNQSEAIASSIVQMTTLTVPIVVFVIGEAMSGGAMAMGVSDHLVMLSNAVFSVISPEGCSGILWKDKAHAQQAANALSISAPELLKNGFIDKVLEEADYQSGTDQQLLIQAIHDELKSALSDLSLLSSDRLVERRHMRLKKISSSLK